MASDQKVEKVEESSLMPALDTNDARCFFCGEECTEANYCYSCRAFICIACDQNATPFYKANHLPDDHILEEWNDSLIYDEFNMIGK